MLAPCSRRLTLLPLRRRPDSGRVCVDPGGTCPRWWGGGDRRGGVQDCMAAMQPLAVPRPAHALLSPPPQAGSFAAFLFGFGARRGHATRGGERGGALPLGCPISPQREHSALRCSRAQPRTAHPRAGPASPGCARAPPSALQARAASVCWFAVHAHAAAGTPQSPRCCPPVSRYALVVPSWACLRTPFGRRWSPVLQWLTGALQVPAPTTWPTPSAPPSAPRRCR